MVHPGAYRGTKRQKELKRLQKQEEKRLKRLQRKSGELPEGAEEPGALPEGEAVRPETPEPPAEEQREGSA